MREVRLKCKCYWKMGEKMQFLFFLSMRTFSSSSFTDATPRILLPLLDVHDFPKSIAMLAMICIRI